MKIVLLGPDGQVGWELQRALAPLGEVVALPRATPGSTLCGDLAQPERLVASLRSLQPTVVVNAAGYTAVDKAESQPALAHTVNALTVGAVARLMAELGGWLVHYSSDYVFDGSGSQPRDESAPTGPLNIYGQTKLDGENLVRASGCQHLILRTSWVHAARGGNFARTMLRLAAERDRLTVIDDQIGAPTGAELLADVSAHALRRVLLQTSRDAAVSGTYHVVAAGEVSWHGYARHVIGWAQQRGLALKCGPEAVSPIATSDYPTPARRPLNSRLATGKLRSTFDLTLPDWQTGVDRMLRIALNLP